MPPNYLTDALGSSMALLRVSAGGPVVIIVWESSIVPFRCTVFTDVLIRAPFSLTFGVK